MVHRGISFKQALNDAIRAGTSPGADVGFTTVVHDMGAPVVNLDRALQIAGELEDEGAEQMLRSGR
ncbi:hypothetical protein [Marmoricola endophyticus]|nr:hypothetical protein [Marmoricola endophyticus]